MTPLKKVEEPQIVLGMHNLPMQRVDYFNLTTLLITCGLFFIVSRNYIFWAWDQGNVLYPSSAISHGSLPNIDFRSGYLGLSFFIESILADLTQQDPLLVSQFVLAAFTGVTAILIYLITRTILPRISALCASFAHIYLITEWPVNNPGVGVTLLLLLGYYIFSFRKNNTLTLIGLGVALGLAIVFKQNAIYGILGITFLLCKDSKIKSIKLLAYLSPILVIFIMIWRGGLINQGVVVMVPLIVCVALFRSAVAETNIAIKRIDVILLGISITGTVFLILSLLYGNAAKVFEVLQETFLIVPRLIDRDKSIGYFSSTVLICLFSGITLFAITLYLINVHAIKRWLLLFNVHAIKRWLLLFMALLLVVHFGSNNFENLSHATALITPFIHWIFHPSVASFYFVLLVYLYKYNIHCPDLLKSSELWNLLIFLSFLLATQSQFSNLTSLAPALVVPVVIYITVIDELINGIFKLKFLMAGFTLIIVSATFLSWVSIFNKPIINSMPINSSFRVQENQLPYIRVAEWLSTNTKSSDTIYGYPNFALSFYLANRFENGFLPNFIGDKDDVNRLRNKLLSPDSPEYFVVSKINFPYRNHPYFYDYSHFIDVINVGYHQVHAVMNNNEEVISIFKAN